MLYPCTGGGGRVKWISMNLRATQRNLVLKNCGGRDGMGRWDADDIPQDEDMAQGLGP